MLTSKQELFAQSVVDGQTQADAYRVAYDTCGMQPASIWTEASKLLRNPQVSARVETLKAEKHVIRKAILLDKEQGILSRLEHEALTAKSDSARIRALELLGRHAGMFTERVEVEQVDRSVEQIHADIRARLERLGWT